jgi:hypothetical protein
MASFEPFVSSDPFNMETFNTKLGGAFGKVDTAIANEVIARQEAITELNKKAGLQHIQTLTSTETARYVSFTYNIDWSQWAEVYFVVKPKFSISTTYQFYFYNASTGNNATMVNAYTSGVTCSIVYPMFDSNAMPNGFVCGYGYFNSTNYPCSYYPDLTIETSSPSSNVLPGTVVEIYGRK